MGKAHEKPFFAGKKRDRRGTCSDFLYLPVRCNMRAYPRPCWEPTFFARCGPMNNGPSKQRYGPIMAIMGWSSVRQSPRGGEIRHGQDGGLCAGLPAEFRDLQERRKPRDAKSPDGAVVFFWGMVGEKKYRTGCWWDDWGWWGLINGDGLELVYT